MRKPFDVALASAAIAALVACGGTTLSGDGGSGAGGDLHRSGGESGSAGSGGRTGASGATTGSSGAATAGRGNGGAIAAGGKIGTGGRVGGGGATPTAGRGGTSGAGGARTPDAGADGAVDGSFPQDARCDDYAAAYLLAWGFDGGLVAYADGSTLQRARQYHHMRDYFMNALGPMCMTEVMGCPSPLLARINAALATKVVQDALAAHTVFGVDSRPVDGQVFRIRAGSGYFDVGTPCPPPSSSCRPTLPAIDALVDALQALDAQELEKPECTAVFGKP